MKTRTTLFDIISFIGNNYWVTLIIGGLLAFVYGSNPKYPHTYDELIIPMIVVLLIYVIASSFTEENLGVFIFKVMGIVIISEIIMSVKADLGLTPPVMLISAAGFGFWATVIWLVINKTSINKKAQQDREAKKFEEFKETYVNDSAFAKAGVEDADSRFEFIKLHYFVSSKRNRVFGIKRKDYVLGYVAENVQTKNAGIKLLSDYEAIFGSDLLDAIKKFDSSYSDIRSNLQTFIDFDIVESEFPHARRVMASEGTE